MRRGLRTIWWLIGEKERLITFVFCSARKEEGRGKREEDGEEKEDPPYLLLGPIMEVSFLFLSFFNFFFFFLLGFFSFGFLIFQKEQ